MKIIRLKIIQRKQPILKVVFQGKFIKNVSIKIQYNHVLIDLIKMIEIILYTGIIPFYIQIY